MDSPVELTVEREVPGTDPARPTRVRLALRLEGAGTGDAAVAEALRALLARLDAALETAGLGPSPVRRRERELAELLQTYRPRQRELVELLHDEGELTDSEHEKLLGHLAAGPGALPRPEMAAPPPNAPMVAAPLSVPPRRAPARPVRPVPDLLTTFRIDSLRQAGAVRARRQISFEEYMALKKHFAERERPGSRSDSSSDASAPT